MYYGRIFGCGWPIKNKLDYSIKDVSENMKEKEILKKMISDCSADYFIITSIPQFEEQEGLKQVLNNDYTILAESRSPGNSRSVLNCSEIRHVIPEVPGGESADYIIYDLRKKSGPID